MADLVKPYVVWAGPTAEDNDGGQSAIHPWPVSSNTEIKVQWDVGGALSVDQTALFGGGGVFDPKRVFFTGCSMGSAYTGWLSQCFHNKQPDAITAFATQSTGLKEKGTVRVQADTQYEISSEIIYFCKRGGTGGLTPSSFFPHIF